MAEKKTAPVAKVEKNDKKSAAKKPGVFKRIWNFIKGIRSELKKVTWPSFPHVVNNTLVVLVVVVSSGVIIGLVDALFKFLMNQLVG